MFLPEGEDPDSLVRKEGKEKMLNRIHDSKTLTEFFFDEIETKESSETPEGMAAAAKKAVPLLNLLPKGILKEILINNLAEKLVLILISSEIAWGSNPLLLYLRPKVILQFLIKMTKLTQYLPLKCSRFYSKRYRYL